MMDTKATCPDCPHRLACASGARLACLARERRAEQATTNRARDERERLKRWNEQSRGKK